MIPDRLPFSIMSVLCWLVLSFVRVSGSKVYTEQGENHGHMILHRGSYSAYTILCVCVFSSHPFWTSSSLDVPAGVTQEEGHTGFLIHLPSAVRALIFVARRIQPFLSLVDRDVEFLCTNKLIVLHPLGIFILVF